jgi:hypothetical protein
MRDVFDRIVFDSERRQFAVLVLGGIVRYIFSVPPVLRGHIDPPDKIDLWPSVGVMPKSMFIDLATDSVETKSALIDSLLAARAAAKK